MSSASSWASWATGRSGTAWRGGFGEPGAFLFTEGHTPSPGPSGVLASPSPLTGRVWLVRSFIVLLVVSSCLLLAAIVRLPVGKRSPDGARPSPSPGGPVRHDGSSHPRHGAPTGKR